MSAQRPHNIKAHTSPLPLRAWGRRGGVVALALWGSSALNATAQEPPVIDLSAPINTAESPPVDIYGGPPLRDPDPEPVVKPLRKPAAAPWEDPSMLQGNWRGETSTLLQVSGGTYSLSDATSHEVGALALYKGPIDEDLVMLPLVLHFTKRSVNGVPAPDQSQTWWIARDLTYIVNEQGEVLHRRLVELEPVSDYGLPPSLK